MFTLFQKLLLSHSIYSSYSSLANLYYEFTNDISNSDVSNFKCISSAGEKTNLGNQTYIQHGSGWSVKIANDADTPQVYEYVFGPTNTSTSAYGALFLLSTYFNCSPGYVDDEKWWSVGQGRKDSKEKMKGKENKISPNNKCMSISFPCHSMFIDGNQEPRGCVNLLDYALLLGHPTVHPKIPPVQTLNSDCPNQSPSQNVPVPPPLLPACSFLLRHPPLVLLIKSRRKSTQINCPSGYPFYEAFGHNGWLGSTERFIPSDTAGNRGGNKEGRERR